MFDRPSGGGAAILVGLDFNDLDYEESLEELKLLAESAGLDVRTVIRGRRAKPDAALFAGVGKVEEIALACQAYEDKPLVIFNHELTAAQQRNLEQRLQCRVLDRTNLILDIFAQRARSHEGKLQVELAQMEYLSTRLIRGWTHLERQKGGIGVRGGPGEKQLEMDRRMLRERVKLLKDKLAKFRRQRDIQRRARQRANVFSVSLVGYTNAGKSTLFNQLTHAQAYAADQLFATLDTTTRKVFLPECGEVVLSDTVGFIKQLPHTLVAAFRATLEEAVQADLVLHVVDGASTNRDVQVIEVNKVLAEIDAAGIPQVEIFNKIDLNGMEPGLERDEYGRIRRVRVSALTGEGMDLIRVALVEHAALLRPSRASSESATTNLGN
ncbi:MAG: GTPase HflX [Sulfuricella sp.]|nr:GTPase HflX [Sulfuricella sp.]